MVRRGHFHGYGPWIGSSKRYAQEHNRRPVHEIVPDRELDPKLYARYTDAKNEFQNGDLPPMTTAHWLLKTRSFHRSDQMWTDPEEAVIWLKGIYAENPPGEVGGKPGYLDLESKITHARECLGLGQDVSWVYYFAGAERMVSYSVVCCPNHSHPELACPLPLG
ncbi:hypothetical protein [Streptomyces sp. C]|uniref:hypothetical protein n=1 Tax=Streptomyces sp. C TaxID=253839 RepID=UPI0001B56C68|nr:hypothetical protein [Streptomyces sp. C]EFL13873.1 predicted protein [Streptomyces sp. C]